MPSTSETTILRYIPVISSTAFPALHFCRPTIFIALSFVPHRSGVCPSVCQSVGHMPVRYCVKTAQRRITQTTPHDSPETLVFWRQQSLVGDPPLCKDCWPWYSFVYFKSGKMAHIWPLNIKCSRVPNLTF